MFNLVFMDYRNGACTYFIGYCTIPWAFHFWQEWATNRSWLDHYVKGMLILLCVFVIQQNYHLESIFFWINLFFVAFFFSNFFLWRRRPIKTLLKGNVKKIKLWCSFKIKRFKHMSRQIIQLIVNTKETVFLYLIFVKYYLLIFCHPGYHHSNEGCHGVVFSIYSCKNKILINAKLLGSIKSNLARNF